MTGLKIAALGAMFALDERSHVSLDSGMVETFRAWTAGDHEMAHRRLLSGDGNWITAARAGRLMQIK